jgi:hypothetical protein
VPCFLPSGNPIWALILIQFYSLDIGEPHDAPEAWLPVFADFDFASGPGFPFAAAKRSGKFEFN